MTCPHCGSDVGDTGVCSRCGNLRDTFTSTGWRPDPTARHEGRYYITGHPTSRVRSGRAKTTDPVGGRMLPGYIDVPSPDRNSVRSAWLGTGVATVVIVIVTAMVWALQLPGHRTAPTPDEHYLSSLHDSGLTDQFNSDANALAHGRQVCRQLDDGGPQQGLPADKIAVDALCPQYSDGFHILETTTVSGIFVLTDTKSDTYVHSISSDSTSCQGVDGYSDIGRDTQLIVKNGKGEVLTTTTLGNGRGTDVTCTFSFTFPITEGQDRYVVSVSHRGEFSYTFEQLQRNGVQIRLGN
ncbi:DUF732 domain-containing protein [Mycolicibacterium komossense]|jgi:hypothetical protein|uniref:DUF732 domain-containing protein n=1 Tax=Mycolicibacterium komossense TaxID=1779 RepID=A0ABT3CJR4_9MYCO|nr:DUF732 domain-containing protein [Mycolicibacterium komossense]MCV7229761.1 DUF732 domain-containing protein [Mycolicibacterium komossense]